MREDLSDRVDSRADIAKSLSNKTASFSFTLLVSLARSDSSLAMVLVLSSTSVFRSNRADSYLVIWALGGMMVSPPMMQGASPGADNWPLDLETGAGTHTAGLTGVAIAVGTLVTQRVVVVMAALGAAVGWGTAAKAGLGKAAQVDTIVVQ